MYATVRLPVLLSVVALCVATPYYFPQQRQLFYSPVAPYAHYPQYSAPLALPPYRQVYYPQAAPNLVSPVAPALRYPAHSVPLATPAKQVLYYPDPYTGQLVLTRDEGSDGSWYQTISNFWTNFASSPTTDVKPAENQPGSGSSAEGGTPAAAAGGEKNEQESSGEEASKEKEDEEKPSEEKPSEENKAKLKEVPQNFVLVGQPQFFGNYGLQRLNPAAVLPSANHGAISSYLLLKNYPGVKFTPQYPQVPQIHQVPQVAADAELIPAGQPGSAALGYQKLFQAAQASASRQQKEYEDNAAVTVEAAVRDSTPENDKPVSESDTETEKGETEEEETGPTIAQAKPKAIALAGPGGVAAAAPVGTALVGPGGMALSAPEATAVAGVKGAASGVVSPATTKHASKAVRTYQLANHNLNYLLNL